MAWLLASASGPETLTLPGFRLHLEVPEEIGPDRLEELVRPGVVLWLQTSSNALKRSVAERVERAEVAYVQVHPPLAASVGEFFGARVHPWVALEGLDVSSYRRWAPLGTAVDVEGVLSEERARALGALRPLAIRWRPAAAPAEGEWARTRELGGLEVRPLAPLPACARPLPGAQRVRLRLPVADADSSASGCGFALRLEVPVSLSEVELRTLLVQHPGAELWAAVRNDDEAASAAALVRLLSEALPTAHTKAGTAAH